MAKYTVKRCQAKLLANALVTAGWFAIGTPIFSNQFLGFNYWAFTTALVVLLISNIAAFIIYNLLEELP